MSRRRSSGRASDQRFQILTVPSVEQEEHKVDQSIDAGPGWGALNGPALAVSISSFEFGLVSTQVMNLSCRFAGSASRDLDCNAVGLSVGKWRSSTG
jgi:hypothetical protein